MSQATSTQPEQRRAVPIWDGARDIAPIMLATIPFALIFGALAAKQALTLGEATLMSALTFAGASQFVALQFWADPLPFWTILLSVLAVNLRHVLYSAAIGRRMTAWTPAERALGFAFLTDPTFALAEARGEPQLSLRYYFGLSAPLYLSWVLFTALGYVFGNLVSRPETYGLDFVATAYFIYLVIGFRKRPNAIPVIVASTAGALAAYLTVGSPWHFAAGAAAGMITAAALAPAERAPA